MGFLLKGLAIQKWGIRQLRDIQEILSLVLVLFIMICLEGLASGPAIEMRTGTKGQDLSIEDPFWEIEADYIAQCACNTTLMLSPDIIIFGGGVMQQEHLKKKVQRRFLESN